MSEKQKAPKLDEPSHIQTTQRAGLESTEHHAGATVDSVNEQVAFVFQSSAHPQDSGLEDTTSEQNRYNVIQGQSTRKYQVSEKPTQEQQPEEPIENSGDILLTDLPQQCSTKINLQSPWTQDPAHNDKAYKPIRIKTMTLNRKRKEFRLLMIHHLPLAAR
ncbi:MAG: hypothetical protein Q9227_002592 [Pyrenula ochraceoflavens]